MPRQFLFIATIVATLMLAGYASGQDQDIRLKDLAPQLSKIVRLKMADQGIRVDRDHWERISEAKSDDDDDENLDKEIAKLIKRGIPEEHAKKFARHRVGIGMGMGGDETPQGMLFAELRNAADCHSSGRSGSNNEIQMTGGGSQFNMVMHLSSQAGTFGLTVRELGEPFQELIISSKDISGLRIQVNSDEGLMLFWQKYDDSIRFVYSEGDHNEAISAKSHDEFLSTYPVMARKFWDQLNELGIKEPLQKEDPKILAAIEALLLKPESAPVEAADAEILLLGDDEYKVRKAAKKKIEANYSAWSKRIRKVLKERDLDTETRVVLEGIVSSAKERANAPESETECFIREHKLMDDREYLASIVDVASEEAKPLIRNRIAELEK